MPGGQNYTGGTGAVGNRVEQHRKGHLRGDAVAVRPSLPHPAPARLTASSLLRMTTPPSRPQVLAAVASTDGEDNTDEVRAVTSLMEVRPCVWCSLFAQKFRIQPPPLGVAVESPLRSRLTRTWLDGRPPHCRCAQALVKGAVWWASGAVAGMTQDQLRERGILDSVFSVRDKLALDTSADGITTLRTDGGAGTLPLVRLPCTHPPLPDDPRPHALAL
jgi:hypothetical protein